MRILALAALVALLATACAEGGPGEALADTDNLRQEGGPGTTNPAEGDMGSSSNSEPGDTDVSEPDLAGCPVGSCSVGQTRCEGTAVVTCEADPLSAGCGIWGDLEACTIAGQTCVGGACETPTGCVDNDGDGYGVMCAPGDDCNDADATAHVGAIELCDTIDNDCDGMTDEGYQLGMACTYGMGACQASGVFVCSPDGGGTVCSGSMAVGSPEVCDGLDNDCNNIVDDGVCTACRSDIFEPNDTAAQAEPLQPNAPKWGYTCPGDTDWFELETVTGATYHLYVTFPEATSDLLVHGYVDGALAITGDTAGRDYEEFVINGDSSKSLQIEVVDRDNVESLFRIVLASPWNCIDEDGFVPNQSISTAAYFPPFWLTEAYMCSGGLSDWYYMGDLTAGEALYISIIGEAFGTDLDLHLWGDPDGDNIFERIAWSTNFDNIEDIDVTVPHTGPFFFEVRDFDGYGGFYDVGWDVQ